MINTDVPIYELKKQKQAAVKGGLEITAKKELQQEGKRDVVPIKTKAEPKEVDEAMGTTKDDPPAAVKQEQKDEAVEKEVKDSVAPEKQNPSSNPAQQPKKAENTTLTTYMATYKIPPNARTTLLNPQTLLQIQNTTKTRLKTLKKRKREQMSGSQSNNTPPPRDSSSADSFPTLIQIESTISAQNVQHALIALAYYAKYGFTSYSKRVFVELAAENIEPRFDMSGRLRGPKDAYMRHIEAKCGVQVRLKGKGSLGELPQMPMGRVQHRPAEEDPHLMLHFHIQGSNRKNLEKAETLAESLIEKVKKDYTEFVHSKMNSYIGDFDWQMSNERRSSPDVNGEAAEGQKDKESSIDAVSANAPKDDAESAEQSTTTLTTAPSASAQPEIVSKQQGKTEIHNQVVKSSRKHVEIDISKVPTADSLLHLSLDSEAKQKLGALMGELL